jgi:phosphoglycolate phosphatase-like HAD superfamily hydrolase
MRVFAGDVVPKKKPDPAIYLLAARELGVDPARRASGQRCRGAARHPASGPPA